MKKYSPALPMRQRASAQTSLIPWWVENEADALTYLEPGQCAYFEHEDRELCKPAGEPPATEVNESSNAPDFTGNIGQSIDDINEPEVLPGLLIGPGTQTPTTNGSAKAPPGWDLMGWGILGGVLILVIILVLVLKK